MNTAAKHTPGPWEAVGFTIEAECNGIVVADVRGPDRRARGKEWREDMDYCQGNARLIAAAPELLAALQLAEAFMAGFEGDELQEGMDGKLAAARAAIAKAIRSAA